IGPHDPIARDIVAHRGGPVRSVTRFRGNRLGDVAIDEAYIYPPPATAEERAGIRLWECGRTELRPGIGPAGLCRMVLIDLETQTVGERRSYRGVIANPQPLAGRQLEVTWAEGGAVRV